MPHLISFHLDLLERVRLEYPLRFITLLTYMSFYLVFCLLRGFFFGLNIHSLFNVFAFSFSLSTYLRQSIISPRLDYHNHFETIQFLINPDQKISMVA